MAEALRGLAAALREAMRKPPTEALLLDHYARLCLIVDEVVQEVRLALFKFWSCLQHTLPGMDCSIFILTFCRYWAALLCFREHAHSTLGAFCLGHTGYAGNFQLRHQGYKP